MRLELPLAASATVNSVDAQRHSEKKKVEIGLVCKTGVCLYKTFIKRGIILFYFQRVQYISQS